MTDTGSPGRGADHRLGADPANEPVRTDTDRIRAAVLACPDVAGLSAGPFGEVASYLPGRTIPGVRVDDDRVEVHVVARYGRPLQVIADQIGASVGSLLAGRPLTVAVDDIVLPGETLAEPESADPSVHQPPSPRFS